MVTMCSDHNHLLLNCSRSRQELGGYRKNSFKYELSWEMEEGCKEVIKKEWCKGNDEENSMKRLQILLSGCRCALSGWNRGIRKEKYKVIRDQIEEIKFFKKDLGRYWKSKEDRRKLKCS